MGWSEPELACTGAASEPGLAVIGELIITLSDRMGVPSWVIRSGSVVTGGAEEAEVVEGLFEVVDMTGLREMFRGLGRSVLEEGSGAEYSWDVAILASPLDAMLPLCP